MVVTIFPLKEVIEKHAPLISFSEACINFPSFHWKIMRRPDLGSDSSGLTWAKRANFVKRFSLKCWLFCLTCSKNIISVWVISKFCRYETHAKLLLHQLMTMQDFKGVLINNQKRINLILRKEKSMWIRLQKQDVQNLFLPLTLDRSLVNWLEDLAQLVLNPFVQLIDTLKKFELMCLHLDAQVASRPFLGIKDGSFRNWKKNLKYFCYLGSQYGKTTPQMSG